MCYNPVYSVSTSDRPRLRYLLITALCLFYLVLWHPISSLFFFLNDTATTEIYTLSLHDALPIFPRLRPLPRQRPGSGGEMSPAWLVSLCCSIPDGWPVHDGQRTYRLSNTKRLCNDIFCQSSCSRPQAISLDGPLPSQPAAGGTKDHAPGSHSPPCRTNHLFATLSPSTSPSGSSPFSLPPPACLPPLPARSCA